MTDLRIADEARRARDEASFDLWIEPGHTTQSYLRDLWAYRDLFLILAWRDVTVRYKQTAAGIAWAVLQPAATVAVMTLVFGYVAGLPADAGAPYALTVLAGYVPWQFFSNALSSGSQSIVANAGLVSKVYFPRLIIPCSTFLVAMIDLAVAGGLLAALMLWYGVWPGWRLMALPPLVLLAMLAALGPALFVTALVVRYRDFRFVLPLLVQVMMYVSPVAYSSAVVRQRLGSTLFFIYSLNPVVGVIDGFRWAIFGGQMALDWRSLALSTTIVGLLCVAGFAYFRRTERIFADVI